MPPDDGPDKISRYEIQDLIARGGMGRVYLARDPNTSRLVVVKLLDATLESSDVRDRFDREARSLASLSHPNIVHIYDYGDFEGSPFIVMEYVRGETLEEKIKRRAQMPVRDKLRLMSELCAGLAHAHASGIVHRDVKPANLMVDQDERLKIIDFGIARVSDSNLTRGGSLGSFGKVQIGTPGYMSPQQTQGDEIDHRTDIFAVGAVCYELLAYREAFPGATSKEIESKLMRTPPEPLAGRVPDLNPGIDEILARALALDPNDRYQNATALEEAFDRCRSLLAPPNTTTAGRPIPPASPVDRPSPSRADAAYARAMAAYNERSYDLARRLLNEALAEQPDHAAASALLSRLDQRPSVRASPPPGPPAAVPSIAANRPARPGMRPNQSEAISVDPTVLIDRASMSPAPEGIEPTMVIERDDLLRRFGHAEPAPIQPASNRPRPLTEPLSRPLRPAAEPGRRAPVPAADPTVMIPPRPRSPSVSARPKPGFSLSAYLQPLWLNVKALGSRQPSPPRRQPPKGASPRRGNPDWTRGALIAGGMLALAALLVLGVIQLARWFSPAGQLLTITKPVGGTILGAGLQCGSKGSACSSTRASGEAIELSIEPDTGYVFTSYTGDCAPMGRMVMSQPRTCGATFDKGQVTEAATWPLTITKPTGGTVLGVNIICGTLGSDCSTSVPSGQVAKLTFQTDSLHQFQQFTGDCDANGETTMTAARTCGATFLATANPRADVLPPVAPPPSRSRARVEAPPVAPPPLSTTATPPPSGPPSQAGPAGTGETPTPVVSPDKPAPPPITAEAHAKEAIERLVKRYCAEYETLKPERVEALFPQSSPPRLRDQFRQYQKLKCTLTSPLEFDRLDAGPAGAAQVKVGIKHVVEMRSGGAPKAKEMIATLKVSRIDLRSDWLIDSVSYEEKPKP
jgi:serine/threonine protein kinase